MKVEFRFNGNPQIILTPETSKEIALIQLAFLHDEMRPSIEFQASDNATITITLCENPK